MTSTLPACLSVFVCEALKKDLDSTRTKFNEVSEKLMEKTRQYQKLQVPSLSLPPAVVTSLAPPPLQGMYETMRR